MFGNVIDSVRMAAYSHLHIIKDIITNAIHAAITIGVIELRELCESPTRIPKRAEDEDQAVAILNHNKSAGYIVSPP